MSISPKDLIENVAELMASINVAAPESARASTPTSVRPGPLRPGELLLAGQALLADHGPFALLYQSDGELVIVHLPDCATVWTAGAGRSPPGRAVLQPDGNLVVYDAQNRARWASGTDGQRPTALRLSSEGRLELVGTSWTAGAPAKPPVKAADPRPAEVVKAAADAVKPAEAKSPAKAADPKPAEARTSAKAADPKPAEPAKAPAKITGRGTEVGAAMTPALPDAATRPSPGAAFKALADRRRWLPEKTRVAPLQVDESLRGGEALLSPNGAFAFMYRPDGDLAVLRVSDGGVMWSAGTAGKSIGKVVLQGDANFVAYDAGGKPVWATATNGKPITQLRLTNAGKLELVGAGWGTAGFAPFKTRAQLRAGDALVADEMLVGDDGAYGLVYRRDGELALIGLFDGREVWSSGTSGTSAGKATLQADGNLVVYDAQGKAVWASGTSGKQVGALRLSADGKLELVGAGWSVGPDPQPAEAQALAALNSTCALLPAGIGGVVHVRLPEMAVSFARGLVLQMWVRPTALVDGACLVELAQGPGSANIRLTTGGRGELVLGWRDGNDAPQSHGVPGVLRVGVWTHVSAVLSAAGVSFYRDFKKLEGDSPPLPLPVETARAHNFVGKGASAERPPFTGAIGDLRLWNRAVGVDAILARGEHQLHGDEPGLVGWWTLEGADGAADRSPFGRHAARLGPSTAGPAGYDTAAHEDRFALQLARDSEVRIGAMDLEAGGLTWQAWVRVADVDRPCTLLELQSVDVKSRVRITADRGALVYTVDRDGNQSMTSRFEAVFRAGEWVGVAVRQAPDAGVSVFVAGQPFGKTADNLLPRPGRYMGLVDGFAGQMAELRLWSRGLTGAELLDTAARRIHGWAPGLLGCWRMDEATFSGTLMNTDPSGPLATVRAARPADRGDLVFGSPPKVAPQRVAALACGQRIGLPALPALGAGGLTLQLWVNPDSLADAPLLQLSGATQRLALRTGATGSLRLSFTAQDPATPEELQVESLLEARRWTQLTVTVDRRGLTCVYRDGQLVAREDNKPMRVEAIAGGQLGGGGFMGALSELRVWSRSLGETEVAANWQRRVQDGPGLVGRWALAGDLGGAPGPATGVALWREAPALTVASGPPATRATVKAACSLLADQSGKGQRPCLVVDLTALDDHGRPLVDQVLIVVLDKDAVLYRGTRTATGEQARRQQYFATRTGPGGKARLLLEATELIAPVLQIRHALMGEGEWALITPDQVIHQMLSSITASELMHGRRATAQTRAGKTGLVATDADKLVKVLRGMLGAAAAFSFEEQSTSALAFGDEPPPPTPLPQVAAGGDAGHFVLPAGASFMRRVGRVLPATSTGGQLAADGGAPESFGLLDDVCDFVVDTVDTVVDKVVDAGKKVVDAAATAVKTVVRSVTAKVDMMIGAARVVINRVMETVEDVVAAVGEVFVAIGKTIGQVIDFIAALFDWADFVETGEYMLTQLKGAISGTKRVSGRIFGGMHDLVRDLEARVLAALGGKALPPTAAIAAAKNDQPPPEPMGPLDYLICLLTDNLQNGTITGLLKLFDPIRAALAAIWARVPTLAAGVKHEWETSGISESFKDPARFIDGDPSEWLGMLRIAVRLLANAATFCIDAAGDIFAGILDVFMNVVELPIDIPLLTPFVETTVLGGKKLTLGRLACLLGAIPATILYKLVTGSDHGPFSVSAPGAKSYGNTTADLALRYIALAPALFGGIVDTIGATNEKVRENPVLGWIGWSMDLIWAVVLGMPAIDNLIQDEDFKPQDSQDICVYLSYTSWVCSVGKLVIDLIGNLEDKAEDACKVIGTIVGTAGGIADLAASLITLIWGELQEDLTRKALSGADFRVELADTIGGALDTAVGVITAFPPPEEPISLAVYVGSIATGHVASLGCSAWAIIELHAGD